MKCSHFPGSAAALLLLLLLMAASRAPTAESVTCSLQELMPCYGAFFSSAQPSPACCAKLREQQPCLCQYIRNPNLKSYANSPAAHRVATLCKVSYPQC